MDPNAALAHLREKLAILNAQYDGDSAGAQTELAPEVIELMGTVEGLDTWLSNGGFMPAAWTTEPEGYYDDMGTRYTPWTDGVATGLLCTNGDRREFIYLNPSSSDEGAEDPTPTVFLYMGSEGDPAQDAAVVHFEPFTD